MRCPSAVRATRTVWRSGGRLELVVALAAVTTSLGCTALRPASERLDGGPIDAGSLDAARDDDAALDCSEAATTLGDETLASDRTLACPSYRLTGAFVVGAGATLTVAPGTTVAADVGALLLVARGGRLEARGTALAPIVFTSSSADPAPGAWRGVVLLGSARTNVGVGATVPSTLGEAEGGAYGGGSTGPESGSCGTLEYVRVAFAGARIATSYSEPGSGLTLAGCGNDTVVDHVQVHRSVDGFGFYGGTVHATHLVASGSEANGVEWTAGFTGQLQFVVVQQGAQTGAAILGSNRESAPAATPVSAPTLFNVTVTGRREGSGFAVGTEAGVALQYGSAGVVRNSVFDGLEGYAFDLAWDGGSAYAGGSLAVTNSMFFECGEAVGAQLPGGLDEGDDGTDDDGGFDETAELGVASLYNRIPSNAFLAAPASATAPSFVPVNNNVVLGEPPALAVDARFEATDYVGAMAPMARTGADWASGWTAYP